MILYLEPMVISKKGILNYMSQVRLFKMQILLKKYSRIFFSEFDSYLDYIFSATKRM